MILSAGTCTRASRCPSSIGRKVLYGSLLWSERQTIAHRSAKTINSAMQSMLTKMKSKAPCKSSKPSMRGAYLRDNVNTTTLVQPLPPVRTFMPKMPETNAPAPVGKVT
eukprot:3370336-Amphidinium_carterae.2